MRSRLIYLCLLGTLSACTMSLRDGSGLLSGVPDSAYLAMARLQFVVTALRQGQHADVLATVPNGVCPSGVDRLLCDSVASLTVEQRNFLVAFLHSSVSSLEGMLPAMMDRLEASEDAAFMRNGNGESVAGKTALGPSGNIYLYSPIVRQYSEARMMALLGHEMLHKADSNLGTWLKDFDTYGPFVGHALADRAGAALTLVSAVISPFDPNCPEILVSQSDARVFYAAYSPVHQTGRASACGRG
ncbi:MAG: hypothetical protein R3B54_13615 [Bdellovibrionota bacterium]